MHNSSYLYLIVSTATTLNKIILKMLNTLKTISTDVRADGSIRTKQIQTPNTQNRLISLEDFLRSILAIKGIFQKGKAMAAIIPIILII